MRVLLASDGSAGAEQAAELVAAMPWPSGTTVEVVAAIEPMSTLVPAMPVTSPGFVSSPEIDAQISDYLKETVDAVVGRLREAGIEAEGTVLRGRPATVLVDEAREHEVD